MNRSWTGRRLAGAALSALLAAPILTVATPAQAFTIPTRQEWTDAQELTPGVRSAQVTCLGDDVVYGAGGRINNGYGAVQLVGVVPSVDLRSVTVYGRARTGYTGSWSVTAFAVCDDDLYDVRVLRDEAGLGTATVRCPGESVLYGSGFRLIAGDNAYLDEVVPTESLTEVRVHAGGVVSTDTLIAYGICGRMHEAAPPAARQRCEGTSTMDAAAAKLAVAVCEPVAYLNVFGVGGKVTGGGGNIFIDALVPAESLMEVGVHATRATMSPSARNAARPIASMADEDEDDWSLTAYGNYTGSWYFT